MNLIYDPKKLHSKQAPIEALAGVKASKKELSTELKQATDEDKL